VKTARAREKVSSLRAAAEATARARRAGECVVLTNGCFDLLHVGHVRSLEQARALGDRLIVAVNGDASIRRAKGPDRPIQSARDRMEIVAALDCVDRVVGFSEDTPIRVIRALRPDVLAKGGDWSLETIVGRELLESWGGRVVRLRVVPGRRSSGLIERIQRGPHESSR
jgi:D-beta-D-heptose 7-phosphate kinase/D-beta-D-heptose 1-phosphate adenosyltransferase